MVLGANEGFLDGNSVVMAYENSQREFYKSN